MSLDCIIRNTGDVCSHLEDWYPRVVGARPFIYWVIDTDDLKASFGCQGFSLVNKPNDLGDDCHYEISGLSDNQGEEFAERKCAAPNVYLCNANGCTRLTSEDDILHLRELLS